MGMIRSLENHNSKHLMDFPDSTKNDNDFRCVANLEFINLEIHPTNRDFRDFLRGLGMDPENRRDSSLIHPKNMNYVISQKRPTTPDRTFSSITQFLKFEEASFWTIVNGVP